MNQNATIKTDEARPAVRSTDWLGADVSGTLTVSVAGYEVEIDQTGFAAGGAIFVRLAGGSNLPIKIEYAERLAAAIQRVARIANDLETLRT